MAGEEDDRGRQFEDAFDDLERYFSSGDRVGRAADREPVSEGTTGAPRGDPASGRTEPGLEEDLLPPDWAPDVGSLQLDDDEEQAPRPPSTDAVEPGEPDTDETAPEESSQDETSIWRGEPGEMGGDDWRRVRDVLGEEEAEDTPDFPQGPADAPQGGAELTLDDLKKAPPEYRDLPGVSEDTVAPGGPEAEPPEPAGTPAADEDVVIPEPDWDEPDIAEVEAAADQLAYEFRDAAEPEDVEKDLLADLDRPGGPRTVRVGPEGLTGPTWEEPTSRVVMAEPVTPVSARRDMPAALLTAAVLAAAALISLAVSKAAFAVVAGLVVLLGQAELYGAMTKRGHQPATALGLVVGGLVLAGAYLKGEAAMLFFIALGLVLSFLWYMAATPKNREGAIGNIGTTMLGIVYVPFLAGYMLVILSQPNSGRALMLAVLGLTFLFDVVAFGVGSLYGARALAPTISPKKSWEGLLGAAVVTFAVAIAGLASIDPIDTWGRAAGLWALVVVFAPLGDLAESAIKRDLGVKDMGSVLPGHGGILDRIDSVLFVAPAAFYFMRLVF